MSPERRYSESKIKEIFSRASEHQRDADHRTRTGLTLSELQDIGLEVGISPDSVAKAAASLESVTDVVEPKTYLGFPVTVARSVQLPDAPSDEEWDELVVDLRRTFNASGEVRKEGSLRQWRNGNLQALIEPAESGYLLRMKSFHEVARNQLVGGLVFVLMNLAFIAAVVLSGRFGLNENTFLLSLMAAAGFGVFGHAAYRLRKWVATRGTQMERVAARALARLVTDSPTTPTGESSSLSPVANQEARPLLNDVDESPEVHVPIRRRERN